MRRLWLIFAQTVTVSLAVLFVVTTVKPEWLGSFSSNVATPTGNQPPGAIRETGPAGHSFREAARTALPSVVHIFTAQSPRSSNSPLLNDPLFRHFFGDEGGVDDRKSGLGSGVIVSADGYILTNHHVIEGADQIEVALNNGKTLRAKPVGGDPETDLAVLKLEPGKDGDGNFPAIEIGSMDNVAVGDVALAIGNPFGVGQTVTMGIVSALGRSHLGINTFENFIQTDAAINPGNSGGALVDTHGRLIGINTAIYSRSGGSLGIGFAIPVSTTANVMEQIIKTGSVTRGWIGIEAQEVTEELAESFGLRNTDGALIAGVQRGSPADAGGVKPGDILIAVAGKPVKDPQAMLDLIAGQKPEDTVAFSFWRRNKVVETTIRVGKRPPIRHDRE
ncbi:MAG: trypsin-like peptidase domain-containing protein [Propionivibrio sp.]|nr:trypsin-like peptidase domain-containing protein [Propionivibrio sp.]